MSEVNKRKSTVFFTGLTRLLEQINSLQIACLGKVQYGEQSFDVFAAMGYQFFAPMNTIEVENVFYCVATFITPKNAGQSSNGIPDKFKMLIWISYSVSWVNQQWISVAIEWKL